MGVQFRIGNIGIGQAFHHDGEFSGNKKFGKKDGFQCRLRRFAVFGSIIRLFGSNVKAVFQFKDIINKERN